MKYFTPQRFLRLQKRDSKQDFLAATREWEQAVERYEEGLSRLASRLPQGIRRFIELGSLHDAHVLGMWHGRTRLKVALQTERQSAKLCILTYSLIDSPSIDLSALAEPYRSRDAVWLYDEIGREEPGKTVFLHDILLSNGWEIRLRFHQLNVERPTALLPAPWPPTAMQELLQPSA